MKNGQSCKNVVGQEDIDWVGKPSQGYLPGFFWVSLLVLIPGVAKDPSEKVGQNFFKISSYTERWGKVVVVFLDFMTCFGNRGSSFYDWSWRRIMVLMTPFGQEGGAREKVKRRLESLGFWDCFEVFHCPLVQSTQYAERETHTQPYSWI
jgi:hypothetical protein